MPEKKYVRATTGFMLSDNTIVKSGQVVAASDRVVQGREVFFEPMEDHVETATRAPGEKRLTPRRTDTVVMTAEQPRRAARKTSAEQTTDGARSKPAAKPAGDADAGSGD